MADEATVRRAPQVMVKVTGGGLRNGSGSDAEATRQAVRGAVRNYPDLWRKRAAEQGRERKKRPDRKMGEAAVATRRSAGKAGRSLPRPCEDRLIPPINGLL